jgi:hypothetical protein
VSKEVLDPPLDEVVDRAQALSDGRGLHSESLTLELALLL